MVVVKPLEEYGKKSVNGENAKGATLKKGGGFELFSTNVVEFEKPGVVFVEFGGCSGDLCREANGRKKLVGESRVNSVETFASVVREAGVFMIE